MANRLMPDSGHAVVVCLSEHLAQLDGLRASFPLVLDALRPLQESSQREHARNSCASRECSLR